MFNCLQQALANHILGAASLGKSSRAALENVYAQTCVLLEDLRRDGGDGAFVTVQSVVDKIPPSIVR